MKSKQKLILVTGGAGFIGANLCEALLRAGYSVIAVDNLITGQLRNIDLLKRNKNFTFIKHDIIEPFEKGQLPKKIDQIYHLACPTGVPNLERLAQEMLLTCSLGTKNIMELAKETGAKVLFSSSSEIYGDPQIFPQMESYTGNVDPIGVRSPYEEGKRFSESLVSMYVRKLNLEGVIVRIFNTYGPKMAFSDTRVIPRFLSQAVKGEPLTVHGNGKNLRTYCYVDDLVQGIMLAMERGNAGEVYNIGTRDQISVADLARVIIKLTGSGSRIKNVAKLSHDHKSRLPSLVKIQKMGWRPKTKLESGILKTIDWAKTL